MSKNKDGRLDLVDFIKWTIETFQAIKCQGGIYSELGPLFLSICNLESYFLRKDS